MPDISTFPFSLTIGLFLASAVVIGVTGWHLSSIADRLADRTGMGEAITGAIFLGASTSLSGIVTSVTAAMNNLPELAMGNAIGGIAAQTAFLAIADLLYPRANLEHAAASIATMLQGTVLLVLLTIVILAISGPELSVWGIHPATPILFIFYIYGMRMVAQVRKRPMWYPHRTAETREDVPAETGGDESLLALWGRFAVLVLILGSAGWVVARTGESISRQTGLSETAVGGFLTAITTSLPELVTAIAAVRQGSQTLALSGIIGGNGFDTLFAAVADIAYREGSIYHAVSGYQVFFIATTMLLTGILLMGLIRREERGIANIGFESFLILVLYGGSAAFLLSR
jgi:cation:H+ antiporter